MKRLSLVFGAISLSTMLVACGVEEEEPPPAESEETEPTEELEGTPEEKLEEDTDSNAVENVE